MIIDRIRTYWPLGLWLGSGGLYLMPEVLSQPFFLDYLLPQLADWLHFSFDFHRIATNFGLERYDRACRNGGLILLVACIWTLLLRWRSPTRPDYRAEWLGTLAAVMFCTNHYLCDDALISAHVANNWLNGNGLRYNPDERVQAFTNPLWLLLFTAVYWPFWYWSSLLVPEKAWWAFLLLSAAMHGGLLVAIHRLLKPLPDSAYWAFIFLLFSSRAFVDFTSSGLEYPLAFLLAFYLVKAFLYQQDKLVYISLLISLSFVNRMDTVVVFIVPYFYVIFLFYQQKRDIGLLLKCLFIGQLPALLWSLFSIVYYGFFFPNTYYAKISFEYQSTAVLQGLDYLLIFLQQDPITMILLGLWLIASPFFGQKKMHFVQTISLLLYLLYFVHTGGDFMGSRFMAVPFLMVFCYLCFEIQAQYFAVRGNKLFLYLTAICMLLLPYAPARFFWYYKSLRNEYYPAPKNFTLFIRNFPHNPFFDKIYYHKVSNLLFYRYGDYPFYKILGMESAAHCRALGQQREMKIHLSSGGLLSCCMARQQRILDVYGLSEPLVARLPTPDVRGGFRPAHIVKRLPQGLEASYISGHNELKDPQLRIYYDKIRLVSRAPLFSAARWTCIWELNVVQSRYDRPYF
jgi:arabinofuranosyltransferase